MLNIQFIMKFREFIGIDISKSTMDIAILTADNELTELKCLNQKALLKQTLENLFDKYKIDRDTVLICGENTGHFGNILVVDFNVRFHSFKDFLQGAVHFVLKE